MRTNSMWWRWLLAGGGLVVAALNSPALAQDPPAVRIATLIRSLGSESYPERTAAHAELARLGAVPREQLVAALQHPEPEVRLRAKELLRRLQIDDLWCASRATFVAEKLSAGEALAALAAQTGNRILLGDQYAAFQDRPVELAAGAHDYWPALDSLCLQSGNRVRPHYDTRQSGLVAITGSRPKHPLAYSGPVRSAIVSARREFKEEFDYEKLSGEIQHAFHMNLQFMWEERFRLVAYRSQPELVLARTDTGAELSVVPGGSATWSVATGGSRQVAMTLRLQPPPTTAQRLALLHLRWGLVAVGDYHTLSSTQLDPGHKLFQDDVQLVVESCQASDGGRCELIVSVQRDRLVTEPQDVFFQEHDLLLIDQHEHEFRSQSQSHLVQDSAVRLKLIYQGESPDSEPRKFVFRYPRIRAQRALDLRFVDVPLPTGRPD